MRQTTFLMSHGNTKNRVIKLFVPIKNVHFVATACILYIALPPIKAGIPHWPSLTGMQTSN